MTTLPVLILGLGLFFQTQAGAAADQVQPDGAAVEATAGQAAEADEAAAAEEEGAAEAEEVAEESSEADEAEEETAEADDAGTTGGEDAAEAEEAAEEGSETGEAEEAAAEAAEVDAEVTQAAPPVEDPTVDELAPQAEEAAHEVAEEAAEESAEEVAEAEEEDGEDGEEEEPSRPWNLTVGNVIGFGLQIDETTKHYYGQLTLGGSYKIHGPISVSANLGVYYTPDSLPNDARQLDIGGASLSVAHGQIFHDEAYTDIRVSGSATVALPLSIGGRAYGNYPTVGAGLSLARSVGPVKLSYGLSFNKFNPRSQVRYLPLCVEDRGAVDYCISGYETNWQMRHRINASYSPMDKLSLSAEFGTTLTRSYAPSSHDPAMSPDYMHDVRSNIRDGFSFGLSAGYQVIDSLSVSLSFSNGGPWRSNGQDIYNPLFDPRLAAMSVGVSYKY